MSNLSLLVPGLLGPLPELADTAVTLPACHALQQWLARGERSDSGHRDYLDQLAALFAMQPGVSMAALSAQVDGIDPGDALLRADPVHFKADLDHALLIGSQQLAIARHEADALIEHFNRHFAEDGLRLSCTHQERWYLHAQQPFSIDSTATHQAIGRNVQHFLPGGEDALRWRKILNEAQMLFYTHEVNQQREARGQLTVNSLWLWGEGGAAESGQAPYDWVMADEVHARGMALASDTRLLPLATDSGQPELPAGDGLLVIDDAFLPCACGDVQAWQAALQVICDRWLQPLHEQLKSGRIDCLHLYSAGRHYQLKRRNLLQFWRRPKPLENDIDTHA